MNDGAKQGGRERGMNTLLNTPCWSAENGPCTTGHEVAVGTSEMGLVQFALLRLLGFCCSLPPK